MNFLNHMYLLNTLYDSLHSTQQIVLMSRNQWKHVCSENNTKWTWLKATRENLLLFLSFLCVSFNMHTPMPRPQLVITPIFRPVSGRGMLTTWVCCEIKQHAQQGLMLFQFVKVASVGVKLALIAYCPYLLCLILNISNTYLISCYKSNIWTLCDLICTFV